MITINIEIHKPNRVKTFFHKSKSRIEDAVFSIVLKLPERFLPAFLMEYLDRYTTKRIQELNHSIIKDTWKEMELRKTIDKIK